MKATAHLSTYNHGYVGLDYDYESDETLISDGDKAIDKWEHENNDVAFRGSYQDEKGTLY